MRLFPNTTVIFEKIPVYVKLNIYLGKGVRLLQNDQPYNPGGAGVPGADPNPTPNPPADMPPVIPNPTVPPPPPAVVPTETPERDGQEPVNPNGSDGPVGQ